MKTKTIIILLLLLGSVKCIAQDFIIQRDTSAFLFHDFDSAYNFAQDDDYLYLPPGQISGTKTIDKKLHIYGAGSMSDSLLTHQETSFSDKLILKQNAKFSTFSGFKLNSGLFMGDSLVENILFTDISIKSSTATNSNLFGVETGVSSTRSYKYFTFIRCFFDRGRTSFHSCFNFTFHNCVTLCSFQTLNNFSFTNNILIGKFVNWSSYGSIRGYSNCNFKNNIVKNAQYDNGGNYFQNNINIGPVNTRVTLPTGVTFDEMFELYTSGTGSYYFATYTDSTNYQIKSTSVAKNAGTDGTDLGIFGGVHPFKFGIGRNPNYKQFSIGTATNNQGQLPIQIKVKAQDQ